MKITLLDFLLSLAVGGLGAALVLAAEGLTADRDRAVRQTERALKQTDVCYDALAVCNEVNAKWRARCP